MIDPKLLVCGNCQKSITTAEYISYGPRCEDCHVGNTPCTTGSITNAARNSMKTDRHAKTCRNSIRSGG
jgi:uncharacterized CHY-type Zn-finger protein